jgi:tetratricopeptide (TPR) repeat protein
VLIDTAAACAQYLPRDKAPAGPRDALTQCIAALQSLQKGAATDPKDAEILKLISEGKKEEAEKLQLQVAQDDKGAGIARSKKAAERYRGIAATAGLAHPKKAREYYAEATKLDPGYAGGTLWHGYMSQEADNLAEAERAYSAVLAMGVKGQNDADLYWATLGLGDIRRARGYDEAALVTYRSVSAEASRLASTDAANAEWQNILAAAYERMGDVLVAQGDLDIGRPNAHRALALYKDSVDIFERLVKADPGNASWQRELSVSCLKVGYVLRTQGDLAGALASYKDALSIYESLAKADPDNAKWQRDLRSTHIKVGGVLQAQGELTEALNALQDSLSIAERLAKAYPGYAEWQRDLWSDHYRVGEVLQAQGNLAGALASFKGAYEGLAKADPGNEQWQLYLSAIQHKVGNVLQAQGDLAGALSIFERLAKAHPNYGPWQIRLAEVYWRLAENGDNPKENWTKVVAILKALDAKGRLDPAAKTMLERAGANLAEADRAATTK